MQDFHAQVANEMSVARGYRLELSCDQFGLHAEGVLPIEDGGSFIVDLAIDFQDLKFQSLPRRFFISARGDRERLVVDQKVLVHHEPELGG